MNISEVDLEQLKYPIGRYVRPDSLSSSERDFMISELEALPAKLQDLVPLFGDSNLSNTYRPDSWTARQVFHHLADSHINSFIRLKLTLTEENAEVKPYDENAWALLPDYSDPIEPAVQIVSSIHPIMARIYKSLNEDQWKRQYFHSAYKTHNTVEQLLALYVWHGNHHLAHLKLAAGNAGK